MSQPSANGPGPVWKAILGQKIRVFDLIAGAGLFGVANPPPFPNGTFFSVPVSAWLAH